MKELQFTKEKEFIPIKELILENNEEIKKIKTLFQREVEYVDFLGPIESFFAYFYLDNPEIKDSDAEKAIKNIKMNYYKNISFFSNYLEKELIGAISQTLKTNAEIKKRKITQHELFLVLNYILWSIDNRKHLGDSRAYLKWICNFFHLLDKEEKQKFDRFYDDYRKKMGLSKKDIQIMKNEIDEEEEMPIRELVLSKIDSESYQENENSIWEEGGFVQPISSEEMKDKTRTFGMGHNEEMNYNCKKCNKTISAHNKDWHEGMCDKCFNEAYYNNE